jgi:hypothetical protein
VPGPSALKAKLPVLDNPIHRTGTTTSRGYARPYVATVSEARFRGPRGDEPHFRFEAAPRLIPDRFSPLLGLNREVHGVSVRGIRRHRCAKRGALEGDCEMSGVIRHRPAMTMQSAPTKVRGNFTGVCSGKLTDRRGRTRSVKDALARYEGRGAGELSCLGGTAPGTGRLIFDRGPQIEFRLTERRTPGQAEVKLRGKAGGSATVRGTARSEDLAEINERCNGPGVRLLRGDLRMTSPGISG